MRNIECDFDTVPRVIKCYNSVDLKNTKVQKIDGAYIFKARLIQMVGDLKILDFSVRPRGVFWKLLNVNILFPR